MTCSDEGIICICAIQKINVEILIPDFLKIKKISKIVKNAASEVNFEKSLNGIIMDVDDSRNDGMIYKIILTGI